MSPPKFLIDECLSPDLARLLTEQGFDATSLLFRDRLGESDTSVLDYCLEEDRILVTHNADDFRRLVGKVEVHPGLIILAANSKERSKQQLQVAVEHMGAKGQPDPRSWMLNRVVEVSEANVADYELPRI